MRPLLGLALLGLAVGGAFFVAAIKTLTEDIGFDW